MPSIVKLAQQEAGEVNPFIKWTVVKDLSTCYYSFFKGLPEGVVETTTLTIRDTLDKHLRTSMELLLLAAPTNSTPSRANPEKL